VEINSGLTQLLATFNTVWSQTL